MEKNTSKLFSAEIILAVFFLSCMSLGTSCCRKDKDKPTYYMPQEFKDYVMFKEGSYWIYEDSLTGNIDSIYLLKNITIFYDPKHDNFKYEKLEQNLYISQFNNQQTAIGVLYDSDPSYYEYHGNGDYIGKSNQFYQVNIYDSLILNNVLYNNVVYVKAHSPQFNYYWAKNIGLIKKIKEDSTQNWLLKKYYINP